MQTNLAASVQELAAAHPLALAAASALLGASFWHRALGWIESTGVDRAVSWLKARQARAASALGIPPAQIAAAMRAEAAILARAAADMAPEQPASVPGGAPKA